MNTRFPVLMMTVFSLLLGAGISVLVAPSANAQISIALAPGGMLQPNQAGQIQQFVVNNAGAAVDVMGVSFSITFADGQNATLAPTITAVDILTGTIFAADNNGVNSQMVTNKVWRAGTLEDGASPPPQIPAGASTIATVTFDTTGITTGSYPVALNDQGFSPADYIDSNGNPLNVSLSAGLITVVPEPSTALYLVIGWLGFGLFRTRRRT